MKNIIICIITFVLLIAPVSSNLGCTTKDDSGPATSVELMKMAPRIFNYFYVVDHSAMRADDMIMQYYGSQKGDSSWYWRDLDMGIEYEQVFFECWIGEATLIQGDFDFSQIRQALQSHPFEYEVSNYIETEVWISDSFWIALLPNSIACGYPDRVKQYIETVQGQLDSLYSDSDFQDVANGLPQSIILRYDEGRFLSWFTHEGLLFGGFSVEHPVPDLVVITAVCKYENENTAQEALEEMKKEMHRYRGVSWQNVSVTRDGLFIKTTGETEAKEFFDSFFGVNLREAHGDG